MTITLSRYATNTGIAKQSTGWSNIGRAHLTIALREGDSQGIAATYAVLSCIVKHDHLKDEVQVAISDFERANGGRSRVKLGPLGQCRDTEARKASYS
jgi:hypothetical protein